MFCSSVEASGKEDSGKEDNDLMWHCRSHIIVKSRIVVAIVYNRELSPTFAGDSYHVSGVGFEIHRIDDHHDVNLGIMDHDPHNLNLGIARSTFLATYT